MKRFITALTAGVLLSVGLAAIPTQAQAHPLAYSNVQYVNKGTPRIINVLCHSNRQWRAMGPGMNSRQVCALNGWVDQIWVDSDVTLKMRLRGTNDSGSFGQGYRGLVFPGNWDVWVNKIAGA
jgi:hypothetical protein